MNLIDINCNGISPALKLLPQNFNSEPALVLLLAIGLQESRFIHRRQMGNGPAMSFWQMERGGGVTGILTHVASKHHMLRICGIRGVQPGSMDVWKAIEYDDVLAAACARLLMWTDHRPLPDVGDVKGMWAYYLRNWRPGKPHESTWAEMYGKALSFVVASSSL